MSIPNESLPVLVGQGGDLNAHRWVIEDTLTIGRTSACDVPVTNRQISRYHAQLTRSGESVILEDLGSKNGTFHNGEMIEEPVQLEDGDVIQVALAQKFLYLSQDATIPLDYSDFNGINLVGKNIPHGAEVSPSGGQRMRLDMASHRIWVNGEEVDPPLSALQLELLKVLNENEGRVLSRHDLITQVWGELESAGVTDQALDALVRRLRNRLAKTDPDHDYVLTVRGQGFRLDNPEIRG